jgi:hypothetical protein
MTDELKHLIAELDGTLFRYAHLTGALELYILVLETPTLQRTISEAMSGEETEWKQIHRFMDLGGERITWYPELSVSNILSQKNALLGYMYGVTLSRMIGDLDYHLTTLLANHFGCIETSGSSWDRFIQQTKIPLLQRQHGEFVYTLLQERHKIEHNKAQIDRGFLERLAKRNVRTTYKEGDSVQKSHVDVLLANQVIREFAVDVDRELTKVLPVS